jgi:FAD/FMN-containing dehydrogenase
MPNDVPGLIARIAAERLILPDNAGFEAARRVWNGMSDKRPAAIVRAREIDDIHKTISALSGGNIALAVRGGGHSLPGLSTCDDGVVLDLAGLNTIDINPATRRAVVDGGALLGDLDRAGIQHGLVVPAGVVSHTGAGGLTLGGGMGWLSRRFGLTIDSLLAVDLITADGSLIQASAENEPELFWGLRGGGGNFGVAVKFHFRMHELGSVVTGTWSYDVRKTCVALLRFLQLARAVPRELTTSLVLTKQILKVTAFCSGLVDGRSDLLAPFAELAGRGEGAFGPTVFTAFQKRSDEHARWGRRYYAKGGYFGEINEAMITCMEQAMTTSPTPDSEIYVLQLGGAVTDVGDEQTAYTGRAAQFYWIVQPIWDDPKDDMACMTWGRQTAAELTRFSMAGNYVNEQADFGSELAKKAYGNSKYRRLQKLKARFDPGNMFRLNQNIVPLT